MEPPRQAGVGPRIQYAKTEDGVSIAYWTLGEGPPLVIPPVILISHLQMSWQHPEQRPAMERLAQRGQVICYDCRGAGMSQRDAVDFSLEAAELDLEAVMDRLGLERFAVYNDWRMGAVAFAYGASHPDRVSHLIHWGSGAFRISVSDAERRRRAVAPLIEQEWEMYTDIFARLVLGWDSPDATWMAAAVRAAHSPASFQLAEKALFERFPEPFLPAVQTPTLALYPLDDKEAENSVRVLASAIDTAHVVGIPMALRSTGMSSLFPNEIGVDAILDFISSPAAPGRPVPAPRIDTSAVRTIVFTDIEGHTEMMQRLGDAKGREVLREHERLTREALAAHGGAEVKAMGDGFMAWFPSAQKALDCAIALQHAINAPHSRLAGEGLGVRMGINAGEPIAEEDDLFGASVIAAARIARQARGGEIIVSDVVRQLVAGKGFLFADRGQTALRGFEDPVRLYEVRWRAEGSP